MKINEILVDRQQFLKDADSRPGDNFSPEDLKRLETIPNLEKAKEFAKSLVGKSSKRRMKDEKIAWFRSAIDNKVNSRMQLIKMMWDLYLAGEGHKVIGSKGSMAPNKYRQIFGDSIESNFETHDDRKEVEETATAGATSAGAIASVPNPHLSPGTARGKKSYTGKPGSHGGTKTPPQPKINQPKTKRGTAKNALDMDTNLFGKGAVKR